MVFLRRNNTRLVPGIAVHLNSHFPIGKVDGKIYRPVAAIYIHHRILQIYILALVRAKCIAEKLYKAVFAAAITRGLLDHLSHVSALAILDLNQQNLSFKSPASGCLVPAYCFNLINGPPTRLGNCTNNFQEIS